MKQAKDILAGGAAALLAVALPVLVLALALESVAFSPSFYAYEFRALDRPAATGFTEKELLEASRSLWAYFRGELSTPQLELPKDGQLVSLYDQRELAHLADVRRLFRLGFAARTAAALTSGLAALFLAFRQRKLAWRWLAGAGLVGSSFALLLFLVGILLVSTNFNRWFTLFHLLSFNNDLWQLDPTRENLIRIFPEEFFQAAARTALLRAVAVLLSISVSCLLLLKLPRPSRDKK